MATPTEDEIRAFAKKIGEADERGNYDPRKRSRLAAGALQYRAELAKEAAAAELEAPVGLSTAEQLIQFERELRGSAFGPDGVTAIVVAVAGALVRREGLSLREEGTPHNE
ncbi:hypothetical protein AAI421_13405 [Rhodococcus aetherivorans]|uniref:hypothetical protein n=1 Tax=Rhodococcus aetherivorans TaxID=191292 RepID=UPI0031D5193F